ncbi:MAG: hypothetical protein ACJ735_05965 [Actinomycetes bacterium]
MLSRQRSRRTALKKRVENAPLNGAGVAALRDRGQTAVDALAPRLDAAREALTPRLETARDVAGQAIVDAGEWAAPRIDLAREQAVTTVREKVAPKVTKAITQAAEASKPVRSEAKTRTDAALAALRGEVGPPRRRRRWHRVSFLLGAGATTGALVALVVRRKEPPYPIYEPTPPGGDPYARPTNAEPPQAPISSLNDEIAGNINPPAAPVEPTAEPSASAGGTDSSDTTIDVTDDPVSLGDGGNGGGRHRRRTRRGEPQ